MTAKNLIIQSDRTKSSYVMAFIAILLIPISGVAIDVYTPSLPAISRYFQVGHSLAQWTITSYLMGMGGFQLIAGSISDSFGRRKPVLISFSVFTLVSILLSLSNSIYVLLLLRFIQGAAVAISVVSLRAILSDLFQGREYYKMASYMTIAWALGPIIAPAIGGYLQHYFNWRASFIFLASYGLTGVILFYNFVEETSVHHHDFALNSILTRSIKILRCPSFFKATLLCAMYYSLILVFSTVAPFILQNALHYSAQQYGKIALFAGLAWFVGNLINRASLHIAMMEKARWSLKIMIALTLLLLLLTHHLSLLSFLIPTILILMLGGATFPNFFARAMSLFPTMNGSASALCGSITSLIAAVASGIASLASTQTATPFAAIFLALSLLAALVFYGIKESQG